MKQLIKRLVIFSICLLTAEYVYLGHMLLQYVTLIVLRFTSICLFTIRYYRPLAYITCDDHVL